MSHTLLILKIYITFKMLKWCWNDFLIISTGFKFSKISVGVAKKVSCPYLPSLLPNVILECWLQWFPPNLDQQTNLFSKLLVKRRLKCLYNLYKTRMRLHKIFKVIMAMFLRDWRTPIWSVKRVYLMRRANGTVWYTTF